MMQILLLISPLEEKAVPHIQSVFAEEGGIELNSNVGAAWAGPKVPFMPVYAGTYKWLRREETVAKLAALPWDRPEEVLILTEDNAESWVISRLHLDQHIVTAARCDEADHAEAR